MIPKGRCDVLSAPQPQPLQPRSRNLVNDENAGVALKTGATGTRTSLACGKKPAVVAKTSSKSLQAAAAAHERQILEEQPEPLAFSHFLIPEDVENIDASDGNNVLLATDYVNDIYAYLRTLEVSAVLPDLASTH